MCLPLPRILLRHQLLYHPVEKKLSLSTNTITDSWLHSYRIVSSPFQVILFRSLHLRQNLRRLYLLSLLSRVCDYSLGVGLLQDDRRLGRFNIFHAGSCMSENVELKDDVPVVRTYNWWIFALWNWFYLHRVGKNAVLYFSRLEFDYLKFCLWICLRRGEYFVTDRWFAEVCSHFFSFDWLES